MRMVKLLPTIAVKFLMRSVYFFACLLFRQKQQKVTFASYRADRLTDNLYFVWKEMITQHPDYEYCFIFKKFHSTFAGKLDYLAHMLKTSYHLATSKYFIVDDYYFPIYVIKPRKGIEIIQVWHGSGALKKIGLSTVGKPFGPSKDYLKHVNIHSNYSKV